MTIESSNPHTLPPTSTVSVTSPDLPSGVTTRTESANPHAARTIGVRPTIAATPERLAQLAAEGVSEPLAPPEPSLAGVRPEHPARYAARHEAQRQQISAWATEARKVAAPSEPDPHAVAMIDHARRRRDEERTRADAEQAHADERRERVRAEVAKLRELGLDLVADIVLRATGEHDPSDPASLAAAIADANAKDGAR